MEGKGWKMMLDAALAAAISGPKDTKSRQKSQIPCKSPLNPGIFG
jgi:hypothetical protein